MSSSTHTILTPVDLLPRRMKTLSRRSFVILMSVGKRALFDRFCVIRVTSSGNHAPYCGPFEAGAAISSHGRVSDTSIAGWRGESCDSLHL
ncbi:hypothetical protein BaRGS_00022500 [Batillaria attramentaria]|uniref:Uncharacterized protein n=1 Tax=Batillaria attramentaria TaxID=370345 RepID=A0ABD0KGE4_9CAEN